MNNRDHRLIKSKRAIQAFTVAKQTFDNASVISQKGGSQNGCFKKTKCACQGVRNVRFSENLACFVFLKHQF